MNTSTIPRGIFAENQPSHPTAARYPTPKPTKKVGVAKKKKRGYDWEDDFDGDSEEEFDED